MIGFKGFNKDLKCRDKQYTIGEIAEEPTAELCETGIHFCEYPLDTLGYYAPGDGSRYCQVESTDEDLSEKTDSSDTKRVTKRLRIGLELSLPALIAAAIKFTFDRATWTDSDKATGYGGAASATGDSGAASATGYSGAASATGDRGAASATGYSGAASATGYRGAASATGDRGAASATGDRGAASATGYSGAASATGYRGAASVSGENAIACAIGNNCAASGALGNWLVIAERDDNWKILDVKTVKVDGKKIKADTFYVLTGGKIIERED